MRCSGRSSAVYRKEGRLAAYKALVGAQQCKRLPRAVDVRLKEIVASFDCGRGKVRVWRITPVDGMPMVPERFFVRSRARAD